MDSILEKLKEHSFNLESLPIHEAFLFGPSAEGRQDRIDILLVTNQSLSPKEKHETKIKVKDIFWEITKPIDIRLISRNDLASQISRKQGLGRIFSGKTVCLYRRD